eukprot:g9071.t1
MKSRINAYVTNNNGKKHLHELWRGVNQLLDDVKKEKKYSHSKLKRVLKGTGLNLQTMECAESISALRRKLRDSAMRASLNVVKRMEFGPDGNQRNYIRWVLIHAFLPHHASREA